MKNRILSQAAEFAHFCGILQNSGLVITMTFSLPAANVP